MYFLSQLEAQFKLMLANHNRPEGVTEGQTDNSADTISVNDLLAKINEDGLLNEDDNEELGLLSEARNQITDETQEALAKILNYTLERGFNVLSQGDRDALDKILVLAGFQEEILANIPDTLLAAEQGYIVKLTTEDRFGDGIKSTPQLFVYEINDSVRSNDIKGYIDQESGEWNDFTWNIHTRDDKMNGNNRVNIHALENDQTISYDQEGLEETETPATVVEEPGDVVDAPVVSDSLTELNIYSHLQDFPNYQDITPEQRKQLRPVVLNLLDRGVTVNGDNMDYFIQLLPYTDQQFGMDFLDSCPNREEGLILKFGKHAGMVDKFTAYRPDGTYMGDFSRTGRFTEKNIHSRFNDDVTDNDTLSNENNTILDGITDVVEVPATEVGEPVPATETPTDVVEVPATEVEEPIENTSLNNEITLINWAESGISEMYPDFQNPTKSQIIQGLNNLKDTRFNSSSQLPSSVQYAYSLQVAMSMVLDNNTLGNIDGMWGNNSSRNFTDLQNKLNTEGFDCGVADGKPGPNTIRALLNYLER